MNPGSMLLIMPRRKEILANGQAYNVFNRGVASLPIFSKKKNYTRFIDLINFYRFGLNVDNPRS